MKKYSRKQIMEAISAWEKQLNEMEAETLDEASGGVVAKYLEKHLVFGRDVIEWRDQVEKWYSDKQSVKDVVSGEDKHGYSKDFGTVKMPLHIVSYSNGEAENSAGIVWPHYNTIKISESEFRLSDFAQAVKFAVRNGVPRPDRVVGFGPAGVEQTEARCSSIIDTLKGKKAWFKLDRKSMYDKYRRRKAGGYVATSAEDLAEAEKFLSGFLRGKEITLISAVRVIQVLCGVLEKSEALKSKEQTDDAERNIKAGVPAEVVIPDYETKDIYEFIDIAAKFYGHPSLYEWSVPDEYEEVEGARRDLDDWDVYRINRRDTIDEEDFYDLVAEEMFDTWEPGETVKTAEFAKFISDKADGISEKALEEYEPDEDQLVHRGVYKSEAYWRA